MDLLDIAKEEFAAVVSLAKRVAERIDGVFRPAGINLVHSSRGAAGQEVLYFHLHVFPRYANDCVGLSWEFIEGDDLAFVAQQLRRAER